MTKVRVGIIGSGPIAQSAHIPGYQAAKDAEVVALCDIKPGVLKEAAAKFNISRTYIDYRELLAADDIDAVSICTPNAFHMQPTIDALEAGKHVLCEKPIARNAKEGQKMVDAANRTGKKLMIGLNNRFRSGPKALKRFIEQGQLGEIYFGKSLATRRRGIPSWGAFTNKEIAGGGPLIDLGVHVLDLTLWLIGFPKPVSVLGATYAKIGTKKPALGSGWMWDPRKFEVEDLGVGLIRFENGMTLFLEASFAANIEKEEFTTTLYGDKGGASLDPLRIFTEYGGMIADVTPARLSEKNSHQLEVAAFVEAIKKDKPVPIPGEEALLTTKILDAIYESSEKGKEVAIRA